MLKTLTIIKGQEKIEVVVSPLLDRKLSYGYTIRDNKHIDRVYYTSKSSLLILILTRLYNRGFKDE